MPSTPEPRMRRSSTTMCEQSPLARIGRSPPQSAAATPMRTGGACVAMSTATRRPHWPWTNVRKSRSSTKVRAVASGQRRNSKVRFGFRDNFVHADTRRGLDQVKTVVSDVNDSEVGENSAHTALAGQWQRALLDDLRAAV